MFTAVVVPCLNEEESLAATCQSLGFGHASPPDDAILVLVDNGSQDDTVGVARAICAASPHGTVHITEEAERGFVPARRAGNAFVRHLALRSGRDLKNVLVVQADADTEYAAHYVDAMRQAMTKGGGNVILEGLAEFAPSFVQRHGTYARLMRDVDDAFFDAVGDCAPPDVIVDDKVSAYRLADAMKWGGHVREFDERGDEVHAGTTRLFIRGRVTGATKKMVPSAIAYPSQRRAVEEPALHFASAGYPHEKLWRESWNASYSGPTHIDSFASTPENSHVAEAVRMRKEHLWGLFVLLPAHVAQILSDQPKCCSVPAMRKRLSTELSRLPLHGEDDLRNRPGEVVASVLRMVAA